MGSIKMENNNEQKAAIGYNDYEPAVRLLHRWGLKASIEVEAKYSRDWELVMNTAALFSKMRDKVKNKVEWQKHMDEIELRITHFDSNASFWAVVDAVNWLENESTSSN